MRKPRCLMFYPWDLNAASGALVLFLSYSKALKRAGYRMDCYAPRSAPESTSEGLVHGVFENVFGTPDRKSPVTPHLEALGGLLEDPLMADQSGRDETSMVAAGVLTSISDYDVVGIQYTRCHSLKHMLSPDMPVVIFTHDLDSLVSQQEEMILGMPAEYQLEDEAARLKPFDLVTVVGPDDGRMLKSVDPELPVIEAPFTTPLDECIAVREDSPGILLWISSAAPFHRLSFIWFWKNVWPRIRQARPECRLVIAGRISDIAEELGAASDPQVLIRGVVEDADELYREADILVAPYYFGLGIKTKVIEALGKGLPVVTTTLGIHNTRIQPGREAMVSDEASGFASHVIKLMSAPALRSELSGNGREYVRKWHDPQKALQPFLEAFEKVRLSKRRSQKSSGSAQRHLYEPLRHLIPWAIQRCRAEEVKSVAMYGAGSHTRVVVPVWRAMGGPAIQNIIVTGEPSERTLMGIPVVSAEEFDFRKVDTIVLSSHGYEHDMATICSKRWPELNVCPIWSPIGTGPDFNAVCQENIPTALYDFNEHTASVSV